MKKFVWIAGALLLFSLMFPQGLSLPKFPVVPSVPDPAPAPVAPAVDSDAEIVDLLRAAAQPDKARIVGVYTGLRTVLLRDGGKRVTTTEKFADLQANTLQLAIDTPGKYPGLDVAIERVFAAAVGTKDVVAVTPEMQKSLVHACDVIIASAR